MRDAKDYDGLKKLPQVAAKAVIAADRITLGAPLADTEVPLTEVLRELACRPLLFDALTLWAHALPARERVWWTCMAARDLTGGAETDCIRAAEAWVFKPGAAAQKAAQAAADDAPPTDDTTLCAAAAIFADGTIGTGALSKMPAPAGASGGAAAAMAQMAYGRDGEALERNGELLILRALDIARGGSGRVGQPASTAGTGAA